MPDLGCWSMLRFRSIGRAHVTSGQPLLGYWKQSRTVNSCTLPVWILIITVSHTVGSLWSSRLRRLQQENEVIQLRVLQHSINCLGVHPTRYTSRLESSQHWLHRVHCTALCALIHNALQSSCIRLNHTHHSLQTCCGCRLS